MRRESAADQAALLRHLLGAVRRRDHGNVLLRKLRASRPPFRSRRRRLPQPRRRAKAHPRIQISDTTSTCAIRSRIGSRTRSTIRVCRAGASICVIPVPLHPARKRERGFNQAELLAELFAARAGLTLRTRLERIRYTTTQTAFDRAERMENLRDAFRLRKKADVRGLRVLLIDDVLTTGSTLSECARVLKAGGAISVHAATAARA